MTGFVRLFAFFSSTVKRLTRSTREVTLVWPSDCLNSIKSPSHVWIPRSVHVWIPRSVQAFLERVEHVIGYGHVSGLNVRL